MEVRQASELEESAFSCPNLPSDIVNRTLEGDIVYVSFGLPFFCTKPYAEVYTMLTTLKRESEMGLELSLQLPESLRSNYDKKVIMRREKQTARYVTMLDKLEGLKI
ncbi:MAG TPA: hypothetical protein VJJ52_05020 [Candidatus Nanoarchaeia archaeon]|nr:hypothetical protein [Candidatus Nanoarchaeia archaeon]